MAFAVLSTAVALGTPAWESADEPGHVENIEALVSGHWYGMQSECHLSRRGPVDCSGIEAHQAPLYYLMLAGWQRVVGEPARPPFVGDANVGVLSGSPELYLHHSASDHRFLLWLRLPNVLLGALTVLFTALAARVITHDRWTPVVAASLVAFLPRMVFLSAVVTNDNLAILLGAVLTFLAVRYAVEPNRWRILLVGAAFGLLITTKLSALPLGVVLVVLPLLAGDWLQRARHIALGIAAALAASGWYLIQNAVRYGDPLARRASEHYLEKIGGLGTFLGAPYRIADPTRLVVVRVPEEILRGFWFETSVFHWPVWANVLFWGGAAAMLVGLIKRRADRGVVVALVTIALAALLSVWVVAFQSASFQARYALVGVAAMAALAALGAERWSVVARFGLPAMALVGTLVTIQLDVFAVHWT